MSPARMLPRASGWVRICALRGGSPLRERPECPAGTWLRSWRCLRADCLRPVRPERPETVYLCHPFLVHAAQAHCGATPVFWRSRRCIQESPRVRAQRLRLFAGRTGDPSGSERGDRTIAKIDPLYSALSACMGSMDAARCAGNKAAKAEQHNRTDRACNRHAVQRFNAIEQTLKKVHKSDGRDQSADHARCR